MDIGFGDTVFPEPVSMNYPTLLGSDGFTILVYSLESVIAEKFEAMIVLDSLNSRMKDFYDVYDIFTQHEINDSSLKEAIRLTCKTRDTVLPDDPAIFTSEFAEDDRTLQLWAGFLNRMKADNIEFKEVVKVLQARLQPIYKEMKIGYDRCGWQIRPARY